MSIVRWILVAAATALGVTLVGSWFLARNEPLEYTAEGKAKRLWHRYTADTPRHDVFVIAIDTLRADALGVYGGDPADSPTLDRFAAECTVFDEAVPAACWTLPSFSSIRKLTNRAFSPARSSVMRVCGPSSVRSCAATRASSGRSGSGATVSCSSAA